MRYNEIKESKSKSNTSKLSAAQKFLRAASGYGYEVERLPEHFWSNEEVASYDVHTVYQVVHFKEGADYEDYIGRAYNDDDVVDIIKRHAAKHEPDLLK